MKRTIGALVFLLCLTAGVSPQGATPQSPDPRVKAALGQIDYKYELTADGDYELAAVMSNVNDAGQVPRCQEASTRGGGDDFGSPVKSANTRSGIRVP